MLVCLSSESVYVLVCNVLLERNVSACYIATLAIDLGLHGSWQNLPGICLKEDYQSISETLQIKILPTTVKSKIYRLCVTSLQGEDDSSGTCAARGPDPCGTGGEDPSGCHCGGG